MDRRQSFLLLTPEVNRMAASVLLEETIEIPFVGSLDEFRAWATSDRFPERGRIDYVAGRIEVDMSPEEVFCHGTLKTEVVGALRQIVKGARLGHLFSDRTRVSCPAVDLSVEPDVVFVSNQSLDSGRVRLVPKATGEPDRFIELEGPPDLVVEIVSDTSVAKDTGRLPVAYFRAGVREFWLVDARRDALVYRIHRRGPDGFEPEEPDAAGYQDSAVFDARFRLTRFRDDRGRWLFDLEKTQ